jgi:hypothetical protein
MPGRVQMGAIVSRELDLLYPRSTKIVTNWLGDRRRRTCSTIEGLSAPLFTRPAEVQGSQIRALFTLCLPNEGKGTQGLWTL